MKVLHKLPCAPEYVLFSSLETQPVNMVMHLDLSDCGLHATGVQLLTHVLLELEHRAEGEKVSRLRLDGNDLGDGGMGPIATFLRLSSFAEALQLRNVGITDIGISQILSGLVANKSVALLDLRNNGLSSLDVCNAALNGVRRFNKTTEVLLA